MQLCYERLAHVFKPESVAGPIEPSIDIESEALGRADGFQILVAVGGNDKRRTIRDWPTLIVSIDDGWPKSHAKPKFVIVGCGEHAIEAAKNIATHVPPERIDSRIGLPDLRKAAEVIARSSFFLGADGGLMHITAALKKPGVAIFCEIRPEWRLHARSKMRAIFSECDINQIPAEKISGEVIRYCEDLLKQTGPRINVGWKPAGFES